MRRRTLQRYEWREKAACHRGGGGWRLESPFKLPMFVCRAWTIRPASHNSSGSRKQGWQRVGEFSRSLQPLQEAPAGSHTCYWLVEWTIKTQEETGALSFIVSSPTKKKLNKYQKKKIWRDNFTEQKMWFMGKKSFLMGGRKSKEVKGWRRREPENKLF